MTTKTNHAPQYDLPYGPLSTEADRLAAQIEHALHDPSATKDVFFQALDRYSDVLTMIEQQRQTPTLVKH